MKTRKSFIIILTAALGLGVVFGNIPSVKAQEEFTLEEITVTAQKREENQQKIPIAMEVISADDIKISGKTDLEELLANVSSVLINRAQDGLRISIRGISDDTTPYQGQQGSMPTVAINMDGVYSNRKNTGNGLFDLERVEVLYGPQSTLYASNSPGGIVNIVTASPKLNDYEVSGTLEYGNYNTLHTEGAMNAPISNTLAMRASFNTSIHDGYLSNGGDDQDVKTARLRALFQPNENLSFLITGELSKSKNYSFGGVDAFVDQDDVDDPWQTDRVLGDPTTGTQKKIYANIDMDVGFGTISLVPSYAATESDGVGVMQMPGYSEINYFENHNSSDENGVELRMASSPDFFFTWILGLNYYDSSQILDQITYNTEYAYTGELKYAYIDEEAKAIFANITYPVTDRFRATVGYRLSRDKVTTHREETMGTSLTIKHIENIYNNPDHKLGVEYDLSENSMIYADYSTSYRSQGLEGAGASGPGSTVANPPPEELKAYSLGSKNRFLNNRLQVNAAAYYYDYKNYSAGESVMAWAGTDLDHPMYYEVVSDPNSSTWGDGTQIGVDLQTNMIITPKDTLNLSVSYLKSEWKELLFTFYYDWEAVGGDNPQSEPGEIEIQPLLNRDYSGKPMTNSPEWTVSASYTHTFNLWNEGGLETRIDALYKGDYKLTWKDEDYPYNYQKDYTKVDVSATYIHSDGKWTLSTYVRNVGNYAEKRGYFASPIDETHVGPPRTYGAVLTVRY